MRVHFSSLPGAGSRSQRVAYGTKNFKVKLVSRERDGGKKLPSKADRNIHLKSASTPALVEVKRIDEWALNSSA